jgi:hypothetical protein
LHPIHVGHAEIEQDEVEIRDVPGQDVEGSLPKKTNPYIFCTNGESSTINTLMAPSPSPDEAMMKPGDGVSTWRAKEQTGRMVLPREAARLALTH